MSTQWLQSILVAIIVSVSVILALRHVAPGPFRLWQFKLSQILGQSKRSAFLRVIGLWLQPQKTKQGGCGSGVGCSSCGGCGTSNAKPADSVPHKFRSPPLQRH